MSERSPQRLGEGRVDERRPHTTVEIIEKAVDFPAQAVDTHVFRVANRTGIAPGRDVLAVERAIEDNVPAARQLHAHHWLILHGRYTCVARRPKCPECPIRDLCLYEEKTA